MILKSPNLATYGEQTFTVFPAEVKLLTFDFPFFFFSSFASRRIRRHCRWIFVPLYDHHHSHCGSHQPSGEFEEERRSGRVLFPILTPSQPSFLCDKVASLRPRDSLEFLHRDSLVYWEDSERPEHQQQLEMGIRHGE